MQPVGGQTVQGLDFFYGGAVPVGDDPQGVAFAHVVDAGRGRGLGILRHCRRCYISAGGYFKFFAGPDEMGSFSGCWRA